MDSTDVVGARGASGVGQNHPHDSSGGPAVVGANWYRFRAGEHIRHERVESVSFVWVVQGSGLITCNGKSFELTSNSILRLPWKHNVDYRPDVSSPFHVGTIHLIPWHDFSVPVVPRVGVHPGDPLLDSPWRRGPAGPERPSMLSSHSTTGRDVIALASYAVDRFLTERTDERSLRSLGTLIADESSHWSADEPVAQGVSTVLEVMIDHILANIDHHLTVAEIARAGQCSSTTATRLFVRFTGLSIVAWSRRRRMQEAALLLRTSSLRVNEVAQRVGYTDPLYFSRVFTAIHDVPPSHYASGQLRP